MIVTCTTPDCENRGEEIEVEEGPPVMCGPCGAPLAPAAPNYEPPIPAQDPLTEVLARLAALEAATPTP